MNTANCNMCVLFFMFFSVSTTLYNTSISVKFSIQFSIFAIFWSTPACKIQPLFYLQFGNRRRQKEHDMIHQYSWDVLLSFGLLSLLKPSTPKVKCHVGRKIKLPVNFGTVIGFVKLQKLHAWFTS